jgi:plasmid maintenance system antidote protein VapI
MDAKGLNETDLISVLGTEAAVSEILTHQRPIQLDAAKKLAQFFHVELDLFLGLDWEVDESDRPSLSFIPILVLDAENLGEQIAKTK